MVAIVVILLVSLLLLVVVVVIAVVSALLLVVARRTTPNVTSTLYQIDRSAGSSNSRSARLTPHSAAQHRKNAQSFARSWNAAFGK